MHTLALIATAAAAVDYTPYPVGSWTSVKCNEEGCNHSVAVCKTVKMSCTVGEGFSVIFVNSESHSGTSKDAFAIPGNVDTHDWGYTSWGKGLRFLTKEGGPYTAKCAGGGDGPVTLVQYIVNGRCFNRAIVDCDADKKGLLEALRDDTAVNQFLNGRDSSTASGADASEQSTTFAQVHAHSARQNDAQRERAAAAVDYTPYPVGSWTSVKCNEEGCNHSVALCKTVKMSCTVGEGFSIIFVNSESHSGTSKDAFAIPGNVDTHDWGYTSWGYVLSFFLRVEYDAMDLNLHGPSKGLRFLTKEGGPYTAECAGGGDGPVTLVRYIVNGRCTNRAIVDCDADKKGYADRTGLLKALRDDTAVRRFLQSLDAWKKPGYGATFAQVHARVHGDIPPAYMEHKEGRTKIPLGYPPAKKEKRTD